MQPRAWLASWAVSAHWLLMSSFSSTSTPKSSAGLLSIESQHHRTPQGCISASQCQDTAPQGRCSCLMFSQLSIPLFHTSLVRMRKEPGIFDTKSREFSSHAMICSHPAWHCMPPLGLTADEGNATASSAAGFPPRDGLNPRNPLFVLSLRTAAHKASV